MENTSLCYDLFLNIVNYIYNYFYERYENKFQNNNTFNENKFANQEKIEKEEWGQFIYISIEE